jgi:hypothetical protein
MYMKWNNWLFTNYIRHIASHEHTNCTVKQFISSSAAQMSRLAEVHFHYTQHIVHQSMILMAFQTAYIIFMKRDAQF